MHSQMEIYLVVKKELVEHMKFVKGAGHLLQYVLNYRGQDFILIALVQNQNQLLRDEPALLRGQLDLLQRLEPIILNAIRYTCQIAKHRE
jgi:hypothetical protein